MIGVLGASGALLMAYGASSAGAVNVSGAVNKPGALVISAPQPLHTAIKDLGGFALNADKRHVRITSADGTVRNVDLTKLGTIHTVKAGDRVDVEAIDPTKSVVVQGGVSRAGAFDFKPGMTVVDVVKEAELSGQASTKSVKVLRRAQDGTVQVLNADLLAMSSGKVPPMPLLAGDTVAVPFGSNYEFSDRDILVIVVIGLLLLLIVD
jgi:protein involved in polysaccharide export with SLBB domain